MQQQAKHGDRVRVHYTGTLADGTPFDSSVGREPLEFELGAGQVIPGFDVALTGMHVGERKTVTIPVDQAYGPRLDDMIVCVPRAQFPSHITPALGQQLQLNQEGQVFMMKVAELGDDTVVLDGNHPLAGETLTFALELVSIA